ncbi:MarR family transcriptional regulator [Sphingomonas sp. LHG3406-1]|uniref:MarR family winged helix-turn-helix transcriptional regulator n=1 Tax=Sphingomonas sp. LHG3406-1 TaxID=2804617 RepID=UPI002630D074|nr:MarR family transcriptional regulator [Sphingomonas sp. LHG3406-1]
MSDDFIQSLGKAFLAHRLRRSSELILQQSGAELRSKRLNVPPRGASMLLLIDEAGPIGVAEIARRLRLSHPLIVRMAQAFVEADLIEVTKDPGDGRRKQLIVTGRGQTEATVLRDLNSKLATAFDQLFAELGCDLIEILNQLDAALTAQPLSVRLSQLLE